MLINALIVLFVLAMAYWWWIQGLFSAFLQLVFVIIAGTLAFALWEVAANTIMGLGGGIAQYAWMFGLLVPFAVILLVLRIVADKLVGGNLQFVNLVNDIGGALFGIPAAVLTAGIFIIGFNHSPLRSDFAGYQPYILQQADTAEGATVVSVDAGSSVLMGIDQIAGNLFSRLAAGSMHPTFKEQDLSTRYPQVATLAEYWRLHPDPNARRIATADSVKLGEVTYAIALDEISQDISPEVAGKIYPSAWAGGRRFIMIDTVWSSDSGVYDEDQLIRIAPSSIQLVTESAEGYETHFAFGWTEPQRGGRRDFFPIDSTDVFAVGKTGQGDIFGWMFSISANQTPVALRARGLWLPLNSAPQGEAQTLVSFLQRVGSFEEQAIDAGDIDDDAFWLEPTQTYTLGPEIEGFDPNFAAREFVRTRSMPRNISVNAISGPYDWNRETGVLTSGDFTVTAAGGGGQRTRITDANINTDTFAPIRVAVTPRAFRSSVAEVLANQLNVPQLKTSDGVSRQAVAAVLVLSGSQMRVYADNNMRGTLSEWMRDFGSDEEAVLYLYFSVDPDSTITAYTFGAAEQPVNVFVPSQATIDARNNPAGNEPEAPQPAPETEPADNEPDQGIGNDGVPDPASAPGARIGL